MVKRHNTKTILVIEGEAEGGRQGQIVHRLNNKETVAHNETLSKCKPSFIFLSRQLNK